MPLKRGKSRKTFESNLHELHHGPQYKRTASKFGKERADAQALAISLKEKRKGRRRRKRG